MDFLWFCIKSFIYSSIELNNIVDLSSQTVAIQTILCALSSIIVSRSENNNLYLLNFCFSYILLYKVSVHFFYLFH